MKRGTLRTSQICVALATVLLFALFSAAFCFGGSPVAEAVLPSSYVEQILDKRLDWWSGENFLNLDRLEKTVDSWMTMEQYDFSALERDPVVVAVIDSGINLDHSLFTGKYDESGAPTTGSGVGEYDVLLRDSYGNVVCTNTVSKSKHDYSPAFSVDDDSTNMHGTHVAGIIAALVHRLDLEKYIKIMPIKAGYPVKDGTSFTSGDLKKAVSFALEHGADVVNMSISSGKNDTAFDIVTEDMANRAIFVAAAGNNQWDGRSQGVCYPAAGKYCIGVMNCRESEENGMPVLADSSNFDDDAYDFCAPGANIYSANSGTDNYRIMSGTSMATPAAALGSALALVKYRAIGARVGNTKSVAEVTQIIRNSFGSYISNKGLELPVFDINMLAAGEDVAYAYIESEDELTRYIGDASPVRLDLKIVPSELSGTGSVEWYVDGAKAGEGFSFVYVPKSELGEVCINAKWTFTVDGKTDSMTTADIVIAVAHQPPTEEFVKGMKLVFAGSGSEVGKLQLGETYVLSLSDVDNFSADIADGMLWYVNDEFKHAGKQFTFAPEEEGTYTIVVKVKGVYTASFEITVDKTMSTVKRIILWVSVALSAVVGVVVTVTSIVAVIRRRRG